MKNWCQKEIQKITKCRDDQARYVEALMRLTFPTLDGLSPARFKSEARDCFKELNSYNAQEYSTMEDLAVSYGL